MSAETGNWILAKRKQRGLTQRQLADRIGISQPQFSQMERGVIEPTKAQTDLLTTLFDETDSEDENAHGKRASGKNMMWRESVIRVLADAEGSMHYTDIANEIISRKYRKDVGATPTNTVATIITNEIRKKGNQSVFIRTGYGEYMLRESAQFKGTSTDGEPETGEPVEPAESRGIVSAFGMYWRREHVYWSSSRVSLLGVQQLGASPVDFAEQKGVYMLHDGRDVIYVGRTTDQILAKRLYQHTVDRLNGRWDRFSWFGVLRVSEKGTLSEPRVSSFELGDWISMMEALLIEGMEPPQNRKRGEDFRAVEYLQMKDPKVKKLEKERLLDEMRGSI